MRPTAIWLGPTWTDLKAAINDPQSSWTERSCQVEPGFDNHILDSPVSAPSTVKEIGPFPCYTCNDETETASGLLKGASQTCISVASDAWGALSVAATNTWDFPIQMCTNIDRLQTLDSYTPCHIIGVVLEMRADTTHARRRGPSILLADETGATIEITLKGESSAWLEDGLRNAQGQVVKIERLDVLYMGNLTLGMWSGKLNASARIKSGASCRMVLRGNRSTVSRVRTTDIRSRKLDALSDWVARNITVK